MGDLTSRVYTGVKRYRQRRGYRRLATVTNESRSKRGRWSWIRMPRRLKIKLRWNPKKLVDSVHRAYVRMMMKLASSSVIRGGAIGGYGAGAEICQFGMRPIKEYDEKMILQIYKSFSVIRPEHPGALAVETAAVTTCLK